MPAPRSDGEFAGMRIPSLEDVLDLADDRHVLACIDVKGATPIDATATAAAVAELIRSRAAEDRTLINCFHYDAFPAARRILPGIDSSRTSPRRCQRTRSQPSELARTLGVRITMHQAAIPERPFSAPRGRRRSLGLGRQGRGKHRPERLARCRRPPGHGCRRCGEGARPSLSAGRSGAHYMNIGAEAPSAFDADSLR